MMYSLVENKNRKPENASNMFSKKTICFVTGASRGLGESIAINFAGRLPAGSVMVLLARSEGNLELVKNRLLVLEKAHEVRTIAQRFDQSVQEQAAFEAVFSHALSSVGAKVEDFEQAMLVNNAGSLEPVLYTRNLPDVKELTEYLSTNVAGMIALTSQFLKTFPAECGASRVVVNISSLGGIQPFKSWAMYCSGAVMFLFILCRWW
jgi:sepiapterin reductase